MSTLQKLKAAKNRGDVAKLLGYVPKGLTFALFGIDDAAKYREFKIPKRAGGDRTILAPNEHLKLLQRRLTSRLYECMKELEEVQPNRKKVTHGFQKSRSIITNAARHRGRRYVFNFDLKDFFLTINFGRVRGFFQKDRSFGLMPDVATTIAQIACWQNSLPQGSPSSPVISNLIGHILDVKMLRLAKECGCRYSRYADDITFSTNQRDFPALVARQVPGKSSVWVVAEQLAGIVRQAGFEINPTKTRMQILGSRQVVTGLIVNERVNVASEYYRDTKAMCRELFKSGSYFVQRKDKARVFSLDPLEGRLAHVYAVKARSDLTKKQREERGLTVPFATQRMCKQFLFYKNFVVSPAPVIVVEGPSDVVYLRAAIKRQAGKFPSLVRDGRLQVRFLKHSRLVRDVLGLGEGVAGMGALISIYHGTMKLFPVMPLHPVILLVDNDGGAAKSVFGPARAAAKSCVGTELDIGLASDDASYLLGGNLYLVKVPHGGGKSKKVIEELFPPNWLNHEIDGKRFDPNKKHGDHSSLGKMAFAKRVVEANAAAIDFSGFDNLLGFLERVIIEHAKVQKAKPASAVA